MREACGNAAHKRAAHGASDRARRAFASRARLAAGGRQNLAEITQKAVAPHRCAARRLESHRTRGEDRYLGATAATA